MSNAPFTLTKTAVASRPRKLNANWTLHNDITVIDKPYELTAEEKEGLSPVEQEVWKALKTTEVLDLEYEIMSIMSAAITKEIDEEILKGLLRGTFAK